MSYLARVAPLWVNVGFSERGPFVAKKGDILTDFITAGFYNDVVKKLRLNLGSRGKGQVDQNQFVTVYNHEAVFKKPWEAVSLGDPRVPYDVAIDDRHSEIGFYTKALASADPHNLAILQEPLPPEIGASAQALVVGSSWLRIPSSAAFVSDQHVYIKVGATNILEAATSGRIEMLRQFNITGGNFLAFVLIGKLSSGGGAAGRFILQTNPTGGATGSLGVPMTATAKIVREDNPTESIEPSATLFLEYDLFSDLVTGDYGPAVKDQFGNWIAVNAPCPLTTP